jgi:polyhydroxybutyrate depolymerase
VTFRRPLRGVAMAVAAVAAVPMGAMVPMGALPAGAVQAGAAHAGAVQAGAVQAGAVRSVPAVDDAAGAPGHPVLAPKSGSYDITLTFDGLKRDYRLHVPPAAVSGQPLPLVLNLHGATQNAFLEEEVTSDMDPNADQNGYLVAYPDGTRISKVLTPDPVAKQAQFGWNAGQCCGLPVTRHIDDVGFLLKVISDVASRTPVDLRRVYVTGISNGGMMAYAMASEASDHVAAISSIAGQVELPTIHPSRPVPTMEFHSVNDPVAKWQGVPNKDPRLRLSVLEGIDQWVKADGCSPSPHDAPTIVGAPGSISAGETATEVSYSQCRSGTEVDLWRFTGSGHVWPGSTLNTGPEDTWLLAGVGRGTVLVDADEAMWQFFQRYELPANRAGEHASST